MENNTTLSFTAFSDDHHSTMIDQMTVENQGERISLYGSLQICCDQQGLANAKQLQHILADAIAYLEQQNLPEKLIYPNDAEEIENPFL